MSALMGLVTLIFDLLTLKLVCESHQWLGNFHSEFGQARPSGSRVICYDMADGQTDEWTAKSNAPLSYGRGHNT